MVKRLFEEFSTANHSVQEMASRAKEWGLTARTTKANPVSKQHMHRILRSPFYSGIIIVNGKLYPHRYDRLISPDLYQRCQDVLAGKNHKRNRKDKKSFAFKQSESHKCTALNRVDTD